MPSPSASARRRAAELADPDELRPLLVRTDGVAARYLAIHVLAIAVASWLVYSARGTGWILPAWLLDGVIIAHLFAVQHETAHGTAFKSKRANKVVTTACGAVLGIAPQYFRLEHIAHHNFTQDPERDPELIGAPATVRRWLWFVLGVPFWAYQLGTLGPHAFGRLTPAETAWIPTSVRPRITREARWMLAVWLIALVVPLALGSDAFLVFWVAPRLLGEPIMRIARLSEHAGRPQVPDVTVNTRTLDVPWPLRRLAWNMPYHAEHHAFPAVPFHALPRLRPILAPRLTPPAGGYLAAQAELLRRR
jgi:fatty acid desaturase